MAFVEWPPRTADGAKEFAFPPVPKDPKPLRIGLIGAGGRGVGMAALFCEHPWAMVTAIAEPMPDRQMRAKERLAKYGTEPQVFADCDEMLAKADIDAVLIATPDYLHCRNVKAAIAAGKHIFCEKPLAISAKDCDDMLRAHATRPDLVFGVGLCLRFVPFCEVMHDTIASGAIGNVKMVYAVDSVAPGGRYYYHNWMRLKKNVCSLLVQKGCHSLDILNWCIGSYPTQVYGSGGLGVFGGNMPNDLECPQCDRFDCPERQPGTTNTEYGESINARALCAFAKEVDVNDHSTFIATYANGVRLNYTEIHFTPHYTREFTFVGDKGQLYGNTMDNRLELRLRHAGGRAEIIYPGKRGGGHMGGDPGVVHDFIAAIREKRQPRADILAGRWCTVLAITAEESIEKNQVVPVPDVPAETRRVATARTSA